MAKKDKNFVHELGERLKKVKNQFGLDIVKFAEKLGVSKAAISNYIHGRRVPDAYFIYKLCREFNLNPEWLLLGKGDPSYPGREKGIDFNAYKFIPCLSEISFLEDHAINTSLVKAWYPFREDWLKKVLPPENFENRVKSLFLYPVTDDGMVPTLNPQELVLVDGNKEVRKNPDPGRIYLVRVDLKIYVFRKLVAIRIEEKNKVVLIYIGDKPDYPTSRLEISQDEMEEYVIGEALWVGREIKK